MISEVIEKLKVLQDILSRGYAIEKEVEELPRNLATKVELVNRMKQTYIDKDEHLDLTKTQLVKLKNDLEEAEHSREKYESQMEIIKTQREYEALDREIQLASSQEQQLRRELQKEEQNLIELQVDLDRESQLIAVQEQELKEEESRVTTATEERKQVLQELRAEEQQIIPGLDEELLFKFQRIIRSNKGAGIVPLRREVCDGCQMILPNQFVNDVRSGKEILFCPYCSKVVFYLEEETEEETPVGDLAGIVQSFDDDYSDSIDFNDLFDEEPPDLDPKDDDIELDADDADDADDDDEGEAVGYDEEDDFKTDDEGDEEYRDDEEEEDLNEETEEEDM